MKIIHSKLSKQTMKRILSEPNAGNFVGHGATAYVYEDKTSVNRVIRIQENDHIFDPEAHLEWAKFCLRSRSKHLPKIYMLAVELDEHGCIDRVITVMERLQEMPEDAKTETAAFAIGDYINGTSPWNKDKQFPEHVIKGFPKRAASRLKTSTMKHDLYLNDMHGGNWMYRSKDGRIVITDPKS